MAKKKHGKKKIGSHRRRRVGAKGEIVDIICRVVGVGVGGVAAAFGVQAANTAWPTLQPAVAPAGIAVLGIALPHFVKGSGPIKSLAMGMGDGLMALGLIMTANQTFLSVPGISGLAMSSNASPQSNTIRKAVAGPNGYINRAVNGFRPSAALGALVSD